MVHRGFGFDMVMGFTPKQLSAWLTLTANLDKQLAASRLSLMALACQGDSKAINKRIEELSR